MTGEDVGLKPSTVEQTKFEYSIKVFNKGLKEEEKKEGLLKRLQNIEGKNKEQLKAIEDQRNKELDAIKNINIGLKPLNVFYYLKGLSQEAENLMIELEDSEDDLDKKSLFL